MVPYRALTKVVMPMVIFELIIGAADEIGLENLTGVERVPSVTNLIRNRLVLEEVLKAMDGDTRRVFNLRLQGYSITEIVKELNITPNCLSARQARGLGKAAKKHSCKKNGWM